MCYYVRQTYKLLDTVANNTKRNFFKFALGVIGTRQVMEALGGVGGQDTKADGQTGLKIPWD